MCKPTLPVAPRPTPNLKNLIILTLGRKNPAVGWATGRKDTPSPYIPLFTNHHKSTIIGGYLGNGTNEI